MLMPGAGSTSFELMSALITKIKFT